MNASSHRTENDEVVESGRLVPFVRKLSSKMDSVFLREKRKAFEGGRILSDQSSFLELFCEVFEAMCPGELRRVTDELLVREACKRVGKLDVQGSDIVDPFLLFFLLERRASLLLT